MAIVKKLLSMLLLITAYNFLPVDAMKMDEEVINQEEIDDLSNSLETMKITQRPNTNTLAPLKETVSQSIFAQAISLFIGNRSTSTISPEIYCLLASHHKQDPNFLCPDIISYIALMTAMIDVDEGYTLFNNHKICRGEKFISFISELREKYSGAISSLIVRNIIFSGGAESFIKYNNITQAFFYLLHQAFRVLNLNSSIIIIQALRQDEVKDLLLWQDDQKNTLAHLACHSYFVEGMSLILENAKNIPDNFETLNTLLTMQSEDEDGDTLLHLCVYRDLRSDFTKVISDLAMEISPDGMLLKELLTLQNKDNNTALAATDSHGTRYLRMAYHNLYVDEIGMNYRDQLLISMGCLTPEMSTDEFSFCISCTDTVIGGAQLLLLPILCPLIIIYEVCIRR